jgi:hypothetical protein
MTKKIILLLVAAIATGGMVWAQGLPGDQPPTGVTPPPSVPSVPIDGVARDWATFGDFRAITGPISTEARHSAGLFSTQSDTFIDPRFHNTDIDNFLHLSVRSLTEIDIGFARNFGGLYLALMYRGGILEAHGMNTAANPITGAPHRGYREFAWSNSLALLAGIAGMGVRLDFAANMVSQRSITDWSDVDSEDEELRQIASRMGYGPFGALTWGARFGDLAPWATVGYRFAGNRVTLNEGDSWSYEYLYRSGAAIAAAVGARLMNLDDHGSFAGAELRFRNTFPHMERATGTWPVTSPTGESLDPEFSYRRHGMMAFGLSAYYQRTVEAGMVQLRFRPILEGGLAIRSNDWYGDTIEWAEPWERWTTVTGRVLLAAHFRPNDLLSFFSGVNVRVMDWSTWSQIGGDDDFPALQSSWSITGVSNAGWGLGMAINPSENVTLGLGLNGLFNAAGHPATLDLSARIRFGGNGNGGAAAAPAPAAPAADDEGGIE